MTTITLFNPGFETGVSADVRQVVQCAQNTGTVSADSQTTGGAGPHSGTWSAKWNPNVSQGVDTLQVLPRVAGQTTAAIPSTRGTHTFSIWIKTNLVQGAHTLILRLRAYDSRGLLLSEEAVAAAGSVPVTTTWTKFTVAQGPVTGTASIQPVVDLGLTTDLNNASFYFDDMSLDVVPQAAPPPPPGTITGLRLEVQKARNDAFVWGVSTWTGYRWAGPSDTASSGVEWLDVLGSTHEINVRRGSKRDGLALALEAGTLNATVYDAAVDPNTNPYIKPGTPIRLVHNAGLGDVSIFTGVIRQVQVTYRTDKPTVVLSAVDRVKDLANINRSGVVSGTFAQRVDDLLTKHGITNVVTGSSTLVLAQNAYDSTLLNHLQLAANTERGRVFVDRENVVRGLGKNATTVSGPDMLLTDQVYTGAPRQNYVLNPSFELGMTGWQEETGTATISNSNAFHGGSSLVKDAPDLGGYADIYVGSPAGPATIAIDPTKVYSVSAKVNGTYGGTVSVDWFDANNSELRYDTGAFVSVPNDGTWQTIYQNNITPPANAAFVKIYIYGERADAGLIAVDAVIMTEGATAVDYFDGDSPGAYWTGEPHLSKSVFDPSTHEYYNDIVVAYDSAQMSNDIYVNNLTYGLSDTGGPLSVETKYGPYRNVTSIATYGAFTQEISTNFAGELDVTGFANDVLAASDAPELRVDSVRWNATKAPERAAALEVFDVVQVEYTGAAFNIDQPFNVLALEHTITAEPDRHTWMVDIDLIAGVSN